ncbi:family 10 glycosylhydrolase [Nonomuraea sp. K274]|uniref:Family 10 glycosylhydrolase n=1 Tax=Nonomuraea cypriaca TaxID=1187855 RepID=A0A931AJH6_9ACTN|nr:family 10 glycosylhydrolase [Nonomuraea cypriaca]MBF8192855.1 family 10 glycosylhydrolase [Nonomuraea cypriaca]
MRTGRPLLAVAVLAAATTGAAYAFGPAGEAPAASEQQTAIATSAPAACKADPRHPKRELRGVWIATTTNIDWPSRPGLSPARQRTEYTKILDSAAKRNLNAVFLQVRPASDALYKSSLEPWSQYLTGTEGKDPGWDPLPFLIGEAHKRGMEFHAWFNPYRASYRDSTAKLPAAHPARRHPNWTIKYGGRLYYNPGLPAVREHVTKVITDVVSRYDVDGVHFDDYFYPYPVAGAKFDDSAAFKRYGKGERLAEWRRDNVNTLVAQVDEAVHAAKNHVKFGISPFGIWRNKSNDPSGSSTSGMSAYDSIYADARAWIKAGTVDYVLPQLYWPRGHRLADYDTLLRWWAGEVKGTGVQLYIGQGLYRVGATDDRAWTRPGELAAEVTANRARKQVDGEVFFSAKNLVANPLGAVDRLARTHYERPALVPLMEERGGRAPDAPSGLRAAGNRLSWTPSAGARAYAVYRVPKSGKDCHTTDARDLMAVVTGPSYTAKSAGTYLVTALDRLHNESPPAKVRAGES